MLKSLTLGMSNSNSDSWSSGVCFTTVSLFHVAFFFFFFLAERSLKKLYKDSLKWNVHGPIQIKVLFYTDDDVNRKHFVLALNTFVLFGLWRKVFFCKKSTLCASLSPGWILVHSKKRFLKDHWRMFYKKMPWKSSISKYHV